jgi:hypothetical protein
MASAYPGGYDALPDPGANLSGPPLHSTQHLAINDAIEAIQVELGLNPSGADATVAATLAALSSRYVAFPTAWTVPAYAGTWSNLGGAFQVAQYRKVGDEVQMRGVAQGGAAGSTIFTLPVGFRPIQNMIFATSSNTLFGEIRVMNTGLVVMQAGNPAYVSLELQFSVI